MALETGTKASLVNQDMTNNKTQAGLDVLTKTTEKKLTKCKSMNNSV